MAVPAANIAAPAIICRRVNPSIVRFIVTPLRLGFQCQSRTPVQNMFKIIFSWNRNTDEAYLRNYRRRDTCLTPSVTVPLLEKRSLTARADYSIGMTLK